MKVMEQKPSLPRKTNQPANAQYSMAPGNYNRESGRKTLYFVGALILIVTALTITALLMINKHSSVLIQSNTIEKTTPTK